VDINGDPLDLCSAMEQDYAKWNPAAMSEMAIRCFEIIQPSSTSRSPTPLIVQDGAQVAQLKNPSYTLSPKAFPPDHRDP
jgi:hypothetical protein